MPVDQSDTQSGVEHPGMDSAGFAFLAGYIRMVVCWRPGVLGIAHSHWDVADGMGHCLRQAKRSAKGE